VLFGAIGEKYDNDPEAKVRPEQGLLRLKRIRSFANIRPIKPYSTLLDSSPLKKKLLC
jgi:3-isopropylmalate dehydrogenase